MPCAFGLLYSSCYIALTRDLGVLLSRLRNPSIQAFIKLAQGKFEPFMMLMRILGQQFSLSRHFRLWGVSQQSDTCILPS